MWESEELRREVASLIREHAAIGYEFDGTGNINGDTLFLSAEGAAHVVINHLRQKWQSYKI